MKIPALVASAVAALFMAPPSLGDDDVVWTHRLDAALQVLGSKHWAAGGALAGPLHVRSDGEIVALVASEGRVNLVRWSPDGRESLRREVSTGGAVKASRLRSDGVLVVAAGTTLLSMSTDDGKVLARQPLGFEAGKTLAGATPNGAWFALPDRLVRVGLDGSRAEKALPLAASPGPEDGLVAMLATDRDECLAIEQRVASHDVRGRTYKPDHTNEQVLTLVGPRAEVIAQAVVGGVRTRREWFWHEPGTDGFLPKAFGVVRTRYEGWVVLDGWAERGNGDFLLVLVDHGEGGGPRRRLLRLDHALRERWTQPFGGDAGATVSPPWAAGLLIHAGPGRLLSYDERGGSERASSLSYPDGPDPSRMTGVAIGRDPEARWIVVEYTERDDPADAAASR